MAELSGMEFQSLGRSKIVVGRPLTSLNGDGNTFHRGRLHEDGDTVPIFIKIADADSILFAEMKAYGRCNLGAALDGSARRREVNARAGEHQRLWLERSLLDHIPFALIYESNVFDFEGREMRFLALQDAGESLPAAIRGGRLVGSLTTTLSIALQVLEALRYIHEQGETHCDVKPRNVCVDAGGRVRLVDFELNQPVVTNDKHILYEKRPEFEHQGTLEFGCVDAHCGVTPSRRGDLESLGYLLLDLLMDGLPWDVLCCADEPRSTKGRRVCRSKQRLFPYDGPRGAPGSAADRAVERLGGLMSWGDDEAEAAVVPFFRHVMGLAYEAEPDYAGLAAGLQARGALPRLPVSAQR
jgi:hypothetical protein